eukprot:COSAG01_NODE_1064_length_11885_cov_7.744358_4_plen_63_part_00
MVPQDSLDSLHSQHNGLKQQHTQALQLQADTKQNNQELTSKIGSQHKPLTLLPISVVPRSML